MKLLKPQVQLFKVENDDLSFDYYLHVITFFDETNVVASGHGNIPQNLMSHEDINIEVYFSNTDDYPLSALTPIVHYVPLGRRDFGTDNPFIKVTLLKKYENGNISSSENIKPVHTTVADAEDDSRPVLY